MGLDPATAMIGSAVIGGLTSKPSGIAAPPKRNSLKEMQDALGGQEAIQNQLIGLESKYTPIWQQQQSQAIGSGMTSLQGLYNSAIPMSAQLGNQFATAMAPAYAQAGQSAMGAYGSMLGPQAMGIYNTMGRQAQQGLEAGYGLTDQQNQLAQQSARAAMAARGFSTGNNAVAEEVLNSYQLGNQRYQQSLGNAQNYLNTATTAAGNAYNMYGAPLMQQLNQVSPVGLVAGAAGYNSTLGAKLFNPESQYNADVKGSNQANLMNTQLANQQASAGWGAGLTSMIGSFGSAYLGNENLVGKTPPPSTAGTYQTGYGMPPYRR